MFEAILVTLEETDDLSGSLSPGLKRYCLHRRWSYISLPLQILRLRRVLRLERPDIVFSMLEYSNIISPLAKRSYRSDAVVIVSERAAGRIELKHVWTGPMRKWLRSRVYRLADAVVAVSRGVAEDLAVSFGIPQSMIHVIYNPVDVPAIRQLSEQPLPCETDSMPLIVSAGRLEHQKGYPYLLQAMKQVIEAGLACRLLILGQGTQRRTVETLAEELGISEYVRLAGVDLNPYRWFRKAYLFVLASLYEGFPNVILEAMSCGTPVVSTACPYGPDEIVCDGVNGILVPPADASSLADAIKRVLQDHELRRRLSAAGLERVRNFDLHQVVNQYHELFFHLILGKKKAKGTAHLTGDATPVHSTNRET